MSPLRARLIQATRIARLALACTLLPGGVIAPLGAAEPSHCTPEMLRPDSLREAVYTSPHGRSMVIVIARESREEDLARALAADPTLGTPRVMTAIGGYSAHASGLQIDRLCASGTVAAVWEVPELYFEEYVRTIQGIEYFARHNTDPEVVNLSIGPPTILLPQPFHADEPMNVITRFAARRNKIVVFAAGNSGPNADTLNPWCVAPWVICVGAASDDGSTLAAFSSRGRPADPVYLPTVVAPGIDITTTHPAEVRKTDAQLAAEERVQMREHVPKEKWDLYTVVSGTSFATPQVTRIAAQILYFLRGVERDLRERHGGALPANSTFSQVYPTIPSAPIDDRVTTRRLVGTWKQFGTTAVAIYPVEPTPQLVKQMILDMAMPMNGYDSSQVGAGFVSTALALEYFGKYGVVDVSLMPVKVK